MSYVKNTMMFGDNDVVATRAKSFVVQVGIVQEATIKRYRPSEKLSETTKKEIA